MALYDRLQSELVDARRRRDELALNTLSLLKSEVVRATKEAGAAGSIASSAQVNSSRMLVRASFVAPATRRADALERRPGRRADPGLSLLTAVPRLW